MNQMERYLRLATWISQLKLTRWDVALSPSPSQSLHAHVFRPIFHHGTSALEQVASGVGRLNRIADGMGQGRFRHLARLSCVASPITEAGPHPMDNAADAVLPQQLRQRVVAQGSPGRGRKD